MFLRIRSFTIVLIALFAVGTFVHSAGATTMSLSMLLGDVGMADMANCQGCDTDTDFEEGGLSCEIVCTVSFAANASQDEPFSPRITGVANPQPVSVLAGQTRLPNPHPPRFLI